MHQRRALNEDTLIQGCFIVGLFVYHNSIRLQLLCPKSGYVEYVPHDVPIL